MNSFVDIIKLKFSNVIRQRSDMHDYQNQAVQFLLDNPYSALFIDLGLGKSIISLTVIIELITRMDLKGYVLVIAPVRVANETWPTEIGLWSHTAPLNYVSIRDEILVNAINQAGAAEREAATFELKKKVERSEYTKKRKQITEERVEKARLMAGRKAVRDQMKRCKGTVHLINREQVEFLVAAWGREWPYKTVFIDESSSLKDHTTKRFKALARVRPLIDRMHQLTATPAAETYMHLFAQIYLLDLGKRFGKHITKFQQRYFDHNHYTRKFTLREGADKEIAKLISDITLTMKAEDYLDLEKPISLIDKVKLAPAEKALYDTMAEEFCVELDNGVEIEAETAAALSQKLLQMASGVLYDTKLVPDEWMDFKNVRTVYPIHDHKIDKLKLIVEEAEGEPILVSYHFDSSRDRIMKAFPKAITLDKKGECIKAWNKKQIPMLLIHPQSGGHGLNLQHGGRRIVFFDIPWSLELYLQLIGRLARQGQKLIVFIHHLVAEGTLDEDVVECLSDKNDAQELLFRLLKKIQANRRKVLQTN
jgi:hypothetical protein